MAVEASRLTAPSNAKTGPPRAPRGRWGWLVLPPLLFCCVLLVASQAVFIGDSFHRDLGAGRVGTAWQLINYERIATDSFYLRSLWISVKISGLATLGTLLLGYPVAYVIARMRSRFAMMLLAGIVASTFITIVVKAFGLMIIFAGGGILNRTLMALGLVSEPVTLLGTEAGVIVGLMQFTLGFGVLLLYGVVQTIPRSFEEAAQAHGAGRLRVMWRIMLPLSLPGLTVGGLMIFNMSMGAFTSAALLGGGRILTLPVLIERTIMMEVKYSMAATLSLVLVVAVALINLASILLLRRLRAGHKVIA
jgi:putative spermidine/putrescine transport system permease protein